MKKQTLIKNLWPWGRTHIVDIVFRSGKTQSIEAWNVKVNRTPDATEVTGISMEDYKGEGFLYIALNEVVGVFHRDRRIRWYGW